MYLGSWKIDDYLTFGCNTHRFDTGAATDADAVSTYRIYEDETATPIVTGSMALLDPTNTAGFYSERVQLTAANGLEKGKSYTIYITATVNSIEGTMSHTFQIEAEVDANAVGDKTGFSLVADQSAVTIGTVNALGAQAKLDVNAECDTSLGDYGANTTTPPTVTQIRTEMDTNSTKMAPSQTLNDYKATGFNTVVPDAAGVVPTAVENRQEMDSNSTQLAAVLSKLLKYVQLLARSDAAIATDNATEITAINADGGSGGGDFSNQSDATEALRDRGDSAWTTGAGGSDRLLMVDTTIATLASQTSFTLTSGSADDNAYNNCTIIIEDASTAAQKAVGIISAYTGATKTVTLKYDLAIFTMATTDKIYILAENALKSTLANRQLNVAADGDIAGNIDGSVASVVGHTAQTGDSFAVVNHADHGNAKLVRSTTPANKLDVSATGEAGLDFANIKNATGAHELTNITVPTVTTLTGHTAQTGDNFARIGAAGASLTDLGGMSTGMKAEVESEANDALIAQKLDHLVAVADADDPVNDSIVAKLAASDGDWSGFDKTTDALEALRDRGDAAWITGGGGSITDILNVQVLIPNSIDLANTATVRIGLGLTNMVDDLPSTAEITPGTITIDRKAIGGTSWSNVVNAAACSELAGLIYYDEVFDSGTGYAAGDSIRITFKSQKITVAANDYEITGTDGWVFQTHIREAMRGTDGANTTVPDAAGIAPTAVEIRQEMDNNSTRLDADISSRAPASEYNEDLEDIRALLGDGGNIFYVSKTGDNSDGTTWAKAKNTIDAAIALCAADHCDRIYIGCGIYDETSATAGVVCDVAGIKIIGAMPGVTVKNTNTTNGSKVFYITADNVWLHNVKVEKGESTSDNAICIDVDGAYISADIRDVTIAVEKANHTGIRFTGGAVGSGYVNGPMAMSYIYSAAGVGIGIEAANCNNCVAIAAQFHTLTTGIKFTGGANCHDNMVSPYAMISSCTVGISLNAGCTNNMLSALVLNCTDEYDDNSGNTTNKTDGSLTYILDDIKTHIQNGFDGVEGAGFDTLTDSLEALRNRGDAAWTTAATVALSAQGKLDVNEQCDIALTDYDPPTRTEVTSDKDAIITEVNANETKIDAMQGNVTDILTDTGTTIPGTITTLQTDSTAIKAKTNNLPSGIKKNVALSDFQIYMVLSSDHVTEATGKTVVGSISKDGGVSFAVLTNAVSEMASGMYKVDLTQAEMNADVVTLKFTEIDCDQRIITIYTS